jgi:hypothetical protein
MRSTPLAGSADPPGSAALEGAECRLRPARACAIGLVALLSAGCGPSPCDRSAEANPPVIYAGGTVERGVYMSSAWDGDDDADGEIEDNEGLLHFPGGMRYDIKHKLGERPRVVQIYLSFDRDGTRSGTLAQAAGNQAEIRRPDDETITVVNGSCSEYWLLVVASAGDPSSEEATLPPGGGDPPEDPGDPPEAAGEPASP